MTTAKAFQRARKPEEISQRREQLLAAAVELFDAEGPSGAGLNAIAAKAGFTKSNVYRYFESREQVLIELFRDEFAALVEAMEMAILAEAGGDVDGVAAAVTRTFLGHPRCCALFAIFSSTLEQNVSEATIAEVKLYLADQTRRIALALNARLPSASVDSCAWAIAMAGSLVAGMWPAANPPPAAAAVLARPGFEHLRMDMARHLPRAIRALLLSIA